MSAAPVNMASCVDVENSAALASASSQHSENQKGCILTSNCHHHKDNIKVHFPEEQLSKHNLEIVIQPDAVSADIGVHLGFLQLHHHYQVRFSIKDDLGEDVTFDLLENLHVKIIEVSPSESGEGHDLVLDLPAYKEKLMKEELTLKSASDCDKKVVLTINARVLGKGKGTPALKNGIHCIGIDADDDSEQSDWQGFD